MTPEELAQLAMYADTAGGPNPTSIDALGTPAAPQMMPTSQPGLPGVDPGALARGVDYAGSTSPYHAGPPAPEDPGFDMASLPHPAPGVSAAPGPEPDMASLPHPAPGRSVSVSAGQNMSVGASGFSQDKANQIEAGPRSKLDKRLAASDAQVAARHAPYLAEQAVVDEEVLTAQRGVDAATQAMVQARADGDALIAAEYAKHATRTAEAQALARAQAEKAKADYRMSLDAIPEVNSGQFYENLGPHGRMGLAAAGFVAGFLDAGGSIKTGFNEQIAGFVRNNIEAQVQNMNRGAKVAAGFKDLWEMTREQSASDTEARERMFGYGLKSLTAKIQSEMGKYESALAGKKGMAAIAALRDAQVKNDFDVQKHIDTAASVRAGQQISAYNAELQASVDSYRISAGVKTAKAQRDHEMAMAKLKPGKEAALDESDYLVDATKSGGLAYRWKLVPGTPDSVKDDIKRKVASTGNAVRGMQKLIGMQEQMDALPPGIAKTRFRNEMQKQEAALRTTILNALILDSSGKAATNQEVTRYVTDLLSAPTWFQTASNRGQISTLLQEKQLEEQALRAQWAVPVQPGDPKYGVSLPDEVIGESERVEAQISTSPNGGRTDENSPANQLAKKALSPEADATIELKTSLSGKPDLDDQDRALLGDWQAYVKAHPDAVKKDRFIPGVDKRMSDLPYGSGDLGKNVNSQLPDRKFAAVAGLADRAYLDKDPEAMQHLRTMAGDFRDDELRGYAEYYLEQIGSASGSPYPKGSPESTSMSSDPR